MCRFAVFDNGLHTQLRCEHKLMRDSYLMQVVQDLGTADIDARLEELLIDGILYAFQEQVRPFAQLHLASASHKNCSMSAWCEWA